MIWSDGSGSGDVVWSDDRSTSRGGRGPDRDDGLIASKE